MNIKMSDYRFRELWLKSPLPYDVRERIVGEIDMLMYDDDPIDLTDNAANTRRILGDLRYLLVIDVIEYSKLITYLEDTVATRLHQLKNTGEVTNK